MTRPTVLVVDDEKPIAEAYAEQLRERYTVRLAHNGEAALAELDEDVDVVLLDRRMPTLSGEEVLDRIREAEYDCRVGMLTGVEPDFDVIEMAFDTYLLKPVDGETLRETVESLLARSALDDQLQEYYSLVSRKVTLTQHKARQELQENEEYQRLNERAERLHEDIDETYAKLDDEQAFRAALGNTGT